MNTQPDSIPLNDVSLEMVSGGYNVRDGLVRFGQSVESEFQRGREVGGNFGGVAGVTMGAAIGAMLGALNGLKNEVGTGVNEAVVGLKTLLQ